MYKCTKQASGMMKLSAITSNIFGARYYKQGLWSTFLYVYIGIISSCMSCSCKNDVNPKDIDSQGIEKKNNADKDSLMGCLHGESTTRKENFDSIRDVTTDNIEKLYSLYEVKAVEQGEFYIIEPKKIYDNARYFTRVIRMENGKQVAARTFYGYWLKGLFPDNNRILFALNSPSVNSTAYKYSFQCKTVLTDINFVPLRGQMFASSKGEYAYIDTIYTTDSGYRVEIVDEIFDGGEQGRDMVDLDFMNKVVRKRTIKSPN